ncbi:MAG: NAD(P)/FAD-dependent oxidoreductase [Actinomycetota bacterium]|nr:NAD(P)/FAD-dependent oxidoreductase [Actinomycetota bacterium]
MSADNGDATEVLDAVVVGAGFSGLYMLIRLRELGLRSTVIEKGDDVGGTWYWNRYPGARCDIDSVDYCYSFSPKLLEEWRWTERFATQPEILSYLEFVADTFDLRRDIRFSTTVTAADFDAESGTWLVRTSDGNLLRARYVVMAVGNLSEPKRPDIPGVDTFAGDSFHTAQWPKEGVDFTGRRVGVIGTGSTGIQAIPLIAEQAEHLFVFQRTPNYSMPARNAPLEPQYVEDVLASFDERREVSRRSDAGTPFPPASKGTFEVSDEEREAMFEEGWRRGGINALSYAFTDFFTDVRANEVAQEFARRKIRELVEDPQTAESLLPSHHIGTKRTCVDTNYFATYNRDNVTLVDLRREPIEAVTEGGIRTASRHIDLDCLVYAVGFDAMTGAMTAIDIAGRGDRTLREAWADGPATYLGLMVADFPNLFLVTGPGSPGVLSNMVVSIEQHVEWIAETIGYLEAEGLATIEASPAAQDQWVAHVNDLANATLYPQAASWYLGANIPGKARVFMPYVNGCGNYRSECEAVVRDGYRGFALTPAASARA